MAIGERIRWFRNRINMTQKELGKLLGVTKASVCCYEKETRTPPIETIIDMMALYNVTSD